MEKESLFVLLVYADDEDTCTPHVFRSMDDLKTFVERGVRQDYETTYAMDCEDTARMEKEIASMKASFDERGGWHDSQGNSYYCEEREIE